ncbi:MAG: hypothetical protein LH606_16145 [Cytophagaceae bacterium]|nr:hypothetical protein [Cytophagaceae bacterium]
MKKLVLLVLFLLTAATGFAQKKKAKATPPAAVSVIDPAEKEDTLYLRRKQVSTQDIAEDAPSQVPLLNGYRLTLQQGKPVQLISGDTTKAPYFVIGSKPATHREVEALPSSDVEAISLYKHQKATAAYGEKARNGAVILKVKGRD